jgi:hypothetical protein
MAEEIIQDFTFESLLYESTANVLSQVEEDIVDIITFCEHPYYLDQPLHAVEKLILKSYYGLPLDNVNKDILYRSFPFDEVGKYLTELEYVQFLIQQGRTNILDATISKAAIELVLACGRRSGKTFLASVITSYEAYKLIAKGDPQKYYKLPQGEEIRIINVASTGDQSLVLAKATQMRILNSKWFIPYVEGKNQTTIRLRTKRDLELIKEEIKNHGKALDNHSSISIEAMACTARGIRGGSVIVGILDEIAHFVDNTGNRSGDVIYEALTPSVATFGLDGKIVCISSPYTKNGIFYDLFLDSKGRDKDDVGDQNKRMFQLPTWEMNDTIRFDFLESEKRRNPESFPTEFGAQFSSTILGFFKYPEKVDSAVKRESETMAPTRKYVHYIAVDPSSKSNGYALAMVHVEYKDVIKREGNVETKTKDAVVILDKWKVWNLDDPEFAGQDYIDEEVISEYINGLFSKFVIGKIAYDQFESTAAVMKFKKQGYNAIKTPFTRVYNMKIFGKLRSLFYEDKIELFNLEQGLTELKALQERRIGKREFIVEAPKQGEITTDDLADVLANASYVALENEVEGNVSSICGTNGSSSYNTTGKRSSSSSFQAHRRKLIQNKIVTNFERARKLGIVKSNRSF